MRLVNRGGGILESVQFPSGLVEELDAVKAVAYDTEGQELGEGEGAVQDGRFELHYRATLEGRPVAYYRLSPA